MSRPLSPNYGTLCLLAICLLFISAFSACSGGGSSSQQSSDPPPADTGGVSFRLVWQQPHPSGVKAQFTPPLNACVDHAINTIAATITSGTTTVSSGSWPCSAHSGFVQGVPAGNNFTLQIKGISSGSITTWSGLTSGITVTAGQVAYVSITMSYVGGDTTKPIVLSISPNSNPTNTTSVPITDRFVIAFDKPMAISTITTTNITLINSGSMSTVSGIVSYVTASNTAEFIPATPLAYNTQYILQVVACVGTTSCITDTGNNTLASDSTNTFTTEAVPIDVPGAPTNVTAKAGNGQVTLDWLASNGTTSYNIYYGLASGISITNGTRLSLDAQAPFLHLGLANNQTYYYLVSAVNSTGETPAVAEVSATPSFPTVDPLPPPSLTVTNNGGENTLTWPTAFGATYNLYRSTRPISPDKNAADTVIRGITTSPHTDPDITVGGTYCYLMTALNSNGDESAESMQVCLGGSGVLQITW